MTAHPGETAAPARRRNSEQATTHDSACAAHRPRRARWAPGGRPAQRPGARTAATVVATVLAYLLGLSGCGGGPARSGVASGGPITTRVASSSGPSGSLGSSGSSPPTQTLAFSRCMRSHGVPGFPDPNSSGDFPPSAKQLSLSNPRQFQEAEGACRDLLPNGGNGPSPAQWQQILSTMVRFAQCMRHHGTPNWPDPTYDTHGRPVFDIDIDPNSPQFSTEIYACQYLLHNYGSRPGWPDLSNYFQYNKA
jgi:hypothetical protein